MATMTFARHKVGEIDPMPIHQMEFIEKVNINGGASRLSTRKCLYESVETVPFGDSSGDGPPRRKQVIEPRIATS